jgi:hypothetical protein
MTLYQETLDPFPRAPHVGTCQGTTFCYLHTIHHSKELQKQYVNIFELNISTRI